VAALCVAKALSVLLLLPLRLRFRVVLILRTLLCSLSCCLRMSLTVLTHSSCLTAPTHCHTTQSNCTRHQGKGSSHCQLSVYNQPRGQGTFLGSTHCKPTPVQTYMLCRIANACCPDPAASATMLDSPMTGLCCIFLLLWCSSRQGQHQVDPHHAPRCRQGCV
jgi:hypothetical protein